jgi:hypothetical protein
MISIKHIVNVTQQISKRISADKYMHREFINGAKTLEALIAFPNDLGLARE